MGSRKLERSALEIWLINKLKESADSTAISGLEIGRRAGMSHDRVRALFTTDRTMTFDEYERLCNVFGYTPWKLLRDAEREVAAQHTTEQGGQAAS